MTEEQRLTVAVARALCVADGNDPDTWNGKPEVSGGITCDVALPTWENYVEAARAVIPVVLEAAAKVADADEGRTIYGNSDYGPNVSIRIAAAIRNLGSI